MNDERKPKELTEEEAKNTVGGQGDGDQAGGSGGDPTAQEDWNTWGPGKPT